MHKDGLTFQYYGLAGGKQYQTFWDWSIFASDEKVRKLRSEGVISAFGSIFPRYVGEESGEASS